MLRSRRDAGTLGSLTFGNATSGLMTLEPVTGALVSGNVLIPNAAGTMVTSVTAPSSIFSSAATSSAGVEALSYATGQTADEVIGTCDCDDPARRGF